MKKALLFSLMFFTTYWVVSQEKVDPYLLKHGGYGYLVETDKVCSVWWAEGAYKVMKDAAIPARADGTIKLWSAKNEYESFIVVVNPAVKMENFTVIISELSNRKGNIIPAENVTVRKVEYVNVSRPTDAYGFRAKWPDPLPVYQGSETMAPGENQPFWITVKVPSTVNAGDYTGKIHLRCEGWERAVPVQLHVWDFTLPETPSVRSGFGFNFSAVKEYENIKTPGDERIAFENYMESFRDYKISPYNPFVFSPIKEQVTGVAWQGGFFDSKTKHAGNYSYRVDDRSATANTEGRTKAWIPVNNTDQYELKWFARSEEKDQHYVVGVECYDAGNNLIVFENRFELYTGNEEWRSEHLSLGSFTAGISGVRIRLFPSRRTVSGEFTGTVWFDDLELINKRTGKNEFPAGDFEVNVEDIDIALDFTEFNKAGKRYFDEFHFTGYNLALKGLGGGTFFSRSKGVFEGFEQGTAEYNRLMERYLTQIQSNLSQSGWLGKEYIYWFDEPAERDYPFVRETNELIKKYAPRLHTFITEHIAGHDISDVTDISCTIWNKLDHNKIRQMNKKGLEHWSYLCTGPKAPWITLFIDHDAVNMRMWLWASYQAQLKGILVWATNWWNSRTASPQGYLQNPWEEAMSFTDGYGRPYGKQDGWGNGDGRFFYPLNRDPNNDAKTYMGKPVPSIRLEMLRDGIEDYEYFTLLDNAVKHASNKNKAAVREAMQLLTIPPDIYTDEKTYSKNPQDMLNYRKRIAESILKIKIRQR